MTILCDQVEDFCNNIDFKKCKTCVAPELCLCQRHKIEWTEEAMQDGEIHPCFKGEME